MQRTIAVLVENKAGVLSRVSGLFSARGFNIHSLTVGETEESAISRMTIVVGGDDQILDQVMKQLNRLIEVIQVVNLSDEDIVAREHMLIKVDSEGKKRSEIIQIIGVIDEAEIVYVNDSTIVIEMTGSERKIDSFIKLLSDFGIKEVVRSGVIAMSRESIVSDRKGGCIRTTKTKELVSKKKTVSK